MFVRDCRRGARKTTNTPVLCNGRGCPEWRFSRHSINVIDELLDIAVKVF